MMIVLANTDALQDDASLGASGRKRVGRIATASEKAADLTRSLLARGLRVTAVEPGRRLVARARDQLDGLGDVRFVNARLEDALLPADRYSAVFSASAIHWIDPDVSWRKAADALVEGGSLALVSYFGLDNPRSAGDRLEHHRAE